MKEEDECCFRWLGIKDVKRALQPEFLDEVLIEKFVELNQKTAGKGKKVVE